METLPFSRRTLSFLGLQSGPDISRWRCLWNYWMRTMTVACQLFLVAIAAYSLFFLDAVLVTSTGSLGIYSLNFLTYVSILAKKRNICSALKKTCEKMDKEAIRKIERYDLLHSLFKMMFSNSCCILVLFYVFSAGFGPETAALLMGIRSEPGSHHPYVLAVLFLFYLHLMVSMILIQFYISVLFIATRSAEQVWRTFCKDCTNLVDYDYESMKKQLGDYNNLMRTVNHELGVLPFHILGMEFIFFALGISFLVTSSGDIEISPYFAAPTIGGVNVLYLISLFQVIELSTESNRLISRAWQMAEECVADPNVITRTEESGRMRKALKFFLITESVVTPKAMDTITIDRPLILSFFSQLIPFTVMIFTTVKELERNMFRN